MIYRVWYAHSAPQQKTISKFKETMILGGAMLALFLVGVVVYG